MATYSLDFRIMGDGRLHPTVYVVVRDGASLHRHAATAPGFSMDHIVEPQVPEPIRTTLQSQALALAEAHGIWSRDE
jgi:hypothetical protein